MRARSPLAAAIAASVLSLTLTACGSDGGASSSEGATVGIAMPTKTSQRWIDDGNNMVSELKDYGYESKLRYADNDPKTQVAQIESMIDQGVDALVIASVDGRSLTDVLKKAAAANIPVIAYDRLILGTPDVDYYASFDNEQVGELQATYITEHLGLVNGSAKGPLNIELFAGSPDDNNARFFWNGSMRILKQYIDDKELVVKSGETEYKKVTTLRWDGATAQKRMTQVLRSSYTNARVDAVLSPYDGMSIGIINALKRQGYGTAAKPLPIVTGQDAETPSVKSIKDGEQSQTVYKDTRDLALVAASMVNAVLHHRNPMINDNTSYNNGKKVVPAYLIKPVSVDKDNYKDVLIDSGYIDASDLK
ncbi:multiple monosaccharide ABC transporter substrate-binding protein [Streptomyces sp. NPDC002577]